jgi:hypothetical protein
MGDARKPSRGEQAGVSFDFLHILAIDQATFQRGWSCRNARLNFRQNELVSLATAQPLAFIL